MNFYKYQLLVINFAMERKKILAPPPRGDWKRSLSEKQR